MNTFSPTGVFNDQNEEFVKKFSETVPLNRMLDSQEISSHIAYLTSDDSSFLTGQNIVVDGGKINLVKIGFAHHQGLSRCQPNFYYLLRS